VPISLRLTRLPGFAAGLVAAFILSVPAAVSAQALPSGWSVADVGAPAAPGSGTLSSGTFSVSSRGFDVNGASDQFTFVYTSVKSDISLIAKVSALQNTDPWSQAGLMVRDSLNANSNQAFVFATPGNGVAFRSRTSTKGGTKQTSGGAGVAPVWLRIDRKSSAVTAYRSTDGVSWTTVATLKTRTNQTFLVGFAVASHTAAASVTATLSSVSLNGTPVPAPAAPQNNPPSVSLSSPAGGATYTAPGSISMTAAASDSDGSVAKVDFYNGNTLLASDSTSPYSFAWTNVAAGSYTLKAVATDNAGVSTTSVAVAVTVNSNQAPAVSLTSPTTGSSFTAPATVTLTASASDADGSIQRVEFYSGSTLLASDTSSPFTFSWLNVLAGSYSLSAVARDNLGATAVSSWSDITVGSTATLSKAVFTPAIVPDSIDYYVFEVFAVGSDPSVAPPLSTQNLGLPAIVNGECVANVQTTILGLVPGSYIATVASVSAGEGTLRSAPFAFTR
jgi:regulation of enolase protein 1 (concanavalin A-like superfamily)